MHDVVHASEAGGNFGNSCKIVGLRNFAQAQSFLVQGLVAVKPHSLIQFAQDLRYKSHRVGMVTAQFNLPGLRSRLSTTATEAASRL